MPPDLVGDVIVATVLATLFAGIGVLSFVAALRWREARTPALVLAWALLQHAVNQIVGSPVVRGTFGAGAREWSWVGTVTGYFIAVPWAVLVEQAIGPGWKSTIRRTWQVFLAVAVAATAFDAATGDPGAAAGVSRVVIAGGALVGLVNLSLPAVRTAPYLRVLRTGYLIFMTLVIHDTLAAVGFLPWRRGAGPLGILIFVGCLAYTIVSHTLSGQQELRAMEHELATARRIQASILPGSAPQLDAAALVFRYVPAAAVAGDLFDFLAPDSRHTGILVADVSGHGVPAALIASMVKVAAAAQKQYSDDPARVLAGIHGALAGELPPGHFVTAVYVYVDLERGLLRHASAGHPPALVWRSVQRTVEPAGATGPLIISIAPAVYPVSEIPLAAGDRVVLYTDGVIEAMRGDGEMFGVQRLSALLAASRDGPDRFVSDVIDALSEFSHRKHSPFEDDCTMIALEVGSSEPPWRDHLPPNGRGKASSASSCSNSTV